MVKNEQSVMTDSQIEEFIYSEIKKNCGDYHIDTNILGYARGGRLDKAIEVTYEVIEKRLEAVKYLLKNREWDCFTVVFTALDRIQHTFWKYLEGICSEEEKGSTAMWSAISI